MKVYIVSIVMGLLASLGLVHQTPLGDQLVQLQQLVATGTNSLTTVSGKNIDLSNRTVTTSKLYIKGETAGCGSIDADGRLTSNGVACGAGGGGGGSFSGTSVAPFGAIYVSDGIHSATTYNTLAFANGILSVTGTTATGTAFNYLFTSRSTSDLSEGANLYYTAARVNALINASSTVSFPAGSTLQYYRGDRTWQTLDTSVVPENTNLYYTDARVNTDINASTTMPIIPAGGLTGILQLSGTRVLSVTTVALNVGGTGQTTAPDDDLLVGNGTAWQLKNIADCTDSGGNHLNYTQSINSFSCGTSSGVAGGSSTSWKFNTANSITPTSSVDGIYVSVSSTFGTYLNVGIAPGFAFANSLFTSVSSNTAWLENIIQNTSNTASASAAWTAENSAGTDTDGYFSHGINAPTYNNITYPTSWGGGAFLETSNDAGQLDIMVSSAAATSRINFQAGTTFATSTLLGYWQNSTASPTNFSVFGNSVFGTATAGTLSVLGIPSGNLLIGGGSSGPITASSILSYNHGGWSYDPTTIGKGIFYNSATGVSVTSVCSVNNGCTGTGTSFTLGSVVFADGAGVYKQDNSKFFWDDTNFRLGIASSIPAFTLSINDSNGNGAFWVNTSATGDLFQVQNASSAILFAIATSTGDVTIHGHLTSSSVPNLPPPTLGACGIGPTIVGNDTNGRITAGSGILVSCVITFQKPYANAPICDANDEAGTFLGIAAVPTISGVTFNGTSLTSVTFGYHCEGF